MDANNSWWVSELLAAHCEAWLYPKTIMLRWYDWLYEMTERDEVKRMEVRHQMLVSRVIKRTDGSTRLLHNITESTAWRGGGGQILKKEEDANH